jgi:hypothetical protein
MVRESMPTNLTFIHDQANSSAAAVSDFAFIDKQPKGFFTGEHAIMMQGMLVSSIMGALYYILNFLYEEIKRRLMSQVTIKSDDPIYRKVLSYLQVYGKKSGSTSSIYRCQVKPNDTENQWWLSNSKSLTAKPEVEYQPGQGNNLLVYKDGTRMWVSHYSGKILKTGWSKQPTQSFILDISCYGNNAEPLKNLVQDAIDYFEEKETDKMKVF